MTFFNALIVDDDPVFQVVAEDLIRAQGVEDVKIAHDGVHALEIYDSNPHIVDLICCDLNMPNMDGVSFIRELSRRKFYGSLIIVSSEDLDLLDTVTRLARIQQISVLGTIKKPLEVEALTKVLGSIDANEFSGSKKQADKSVWSGRRTNQVIHERRFNPVYQPKLSLISKKIESVEVLGRVLGDSGEYESPAPFLEAAENHGVITRATEDLAEQVAHDLARWAKQNRDLKASINLSPLSLSDIQFPDRLERIFRLQNIDRRLITLEITENRVMSYGADMLDVLSRFRLKGFRLSLDDFGTGAASIEQLRLYPFNELKIDQTFIKDVTSNPFSKIAVDTAIKMGRQLDLRVVAEGIEDKESLQYVRSQGIDEVQGFLIAKPMTAAELTNWTNQIAERSRKNKTQSAA